MSLGPHITDFSAKDRPIYEQAIREFFKYNEVLAIGLSSWNPTSDDGGLYYISQNMNRGHYDLSDFWTYFDLVRSTRKTLIDNGMAMKRGADEHDAAKQEVAKLQRKVEQLKGWNKVQSQTISDCMNKAAKLSLYKDNAEAWVALFKLIRRYNEDYVNLLDKTNVEVALEVVEQWAKNSAKLATLMEKLDDALDEASDLGDEDGDEVSVVDIDFGNITAALDRLARGR